MGALEGEPAIARCQAGDSVTASACGVEDVCPIRDPMQRLRFDLWRLLERTSLRDLARPLSPLPTPTD